MKRMSILEIFDQRPAVILSAAKDLSMRGRSHNVLSAAAASIVRSLAVCAARDDSVF
jgi:hypothetical protein